MQKCELCGDKTPDAVKAFVVRDGKSIRLCGSCFIAAVEDPIPDNDLHETEEFAR